MKQRELFANDEVSTQESRDPNPCVRQYGFGPVGKTCGYCVNLYAHGHEKNYWKCSLRKNTHGPATDHRYRWNACKKFVEDV